MNDYDPAEVRIRPAATVMLVADRPDLQVLMLRRSARQIFAGDMWVYPGGAVDPDDAAAAAAHVDGLDDPAASERLGLSAGGLAFWVAAVRECFEEAGVLFAGDAVAGRAGMVERLEVARRELNAGQRSFVQILHEEGLRVDLSPVRYIAHWITPLGPPRRFDTRFFLAPMPLGQTPLHDDHEAVTHAWIRPSEAVAAWRDDRMAMMSPTARMLMCLARFDSAADAMAAASSDHPFEQVRVRRDDDDTYHILLPGDAGYEEGDPDGEFGWVGLSKQHARSSTGPEG